MNGRRTSGRGLILAAVAVAGLSMGLPIASRAQSAGDQVNSGQTTVNPPSRVGRLAEASGTVSFHSSDESQWQAATVNYPVTSGNSFWTEPGAHAAIDVGPSRVYLDSSTELDVGTLDDQGFIASLPRGSVFLRVSDSAGTTPYEIDTPRGQVHITQAGHYEVVAGDADHPTVVTAFDGGAQVTGQGVSLAIGPQQAAAVSGAGTSQDPFQSATGAAQAPDQFAQYVQGAEQPYEAAEGQPQQQEQAQPQEQAQQPQPQVAAGGQVPPPPGPSGMVSPGMTGAEDLSQYGSWQSTPDYGQVWYPQVSAGWAPYRYGHWAYVAPWGWTWIDDAPWGFAPFHYGRWVWYGGAWAWAPGPYQPYPVYAPALVSFFGDVGGIGVGIGDVGWVPLGWGEPYYPSYGVSYNCFSALNIGFVSISIVNYNHYHDYYYGGHRDDHRYGYDHWHNYQHGATMVRADVMQHSRPVGQAWRQSPQGGWNQQWAHAKSWDGHAPVKPTYATAGMSPRTAHQLGLNAPAGGFAQHRAPGPAIAANQFHNGHAVMPTGFAANGTPNGTHGQVQSARQYFANAHGNTTTAHALTPPVNGGQNHGQPLGNGHGNQPLFANGQNGLKGNTGPGNNGTLVGHYMKTPPLLGTNGNGANHGFAGTGGQGFAANGQQGTHNAQSGTNQARNYFQQPGQTGTGTHNTQFGTNQARNYFQQPGQAGAGTHNTQFGTNQARSYFQQPAQAGSGTHNWQSGGSQTRKVFQPPAQANLGTRTWQNGGGHTPTVRQPRQTFSQGGTFHQPQHNAVPNNNHGGWGGNFTRQQVRQPQHTVRNNQAPTTIRKKSNN